MLYKVMREFCSVSGDNFLTESVGNETRFDFQCFTTLTENDGVGSPFRVPCGGAPLARVEWEVGKTSSDLYPEGP